MIPDNQTIENFDLIWRFSDDKKYTQLSMDEFDRFHPFSDIESIKLWEKYVYPSTNLLERHISEMVARNSIFLENRTQFENKSDDTLQKWLKLQIPVTVSTTIFFFWHAEVSVRTDWELFLNHWDDFCYPSDDSNIIVFPEAEKCIIYIEDCWYILTRKKGKTVFEK